MLCYVRLCYVYMYIGCQISSQVLKASSWNQGETTTILKMAKIQSSKFSTWGLRNRTLILWYWYIHVFVGYHHFVCSHIRSQFLVPLRRHLPSRMEAGQLKGLRGAVPSWPLAVDYDECIPCITWDSGVLEQEHLIQYQHRHAPSLQKCKNIIAGWLQGWDPDFHRAMASWEGAQSQNVSVFQSILLIAGVTCWEAKLVPSPKVWTTYQHIPSGLDTHLGWVRIRISYLIPSAVCYLYTYIICTHPIAEGHNGSPPTNMAWESLGILFAVHSGNLCVAMGIAGLLWGFCRIQLVSFWDFVAQALWPSRLRSLHPATDLRPPLVWWSSTGVFEPVISPASSQRSQQPPQISGIQRTYGEMQFHFPFDSINPDFHCDCQVDCDCHRQFLCQDLTKGQPSRLDLKADAATECADAAVSKM